MSPVPSVGNVVAQILIHSEHHKATSDFAAAPRQAVESALMELGFEKAPVHNGVERALSSGFVVAASNGKVLRAITVK